MECLGLCYRENFASEQIDKGLEPHFVSAVYYPLWQPYLMPEVIVDITGYLDKKIQATLALKDQMKGHGGFIPNIYSKEALESMIPDYQKIMHDSLEVGKKFNIERRNTSARFWGEKVMFSGTPFGEPFRRKAPLKLDLLQC
jgi:hypothetical protein